MPKIDKKLLRAACEAYDDNSCGEESADDTGMWAAIDAYEAAKVSDQPDEESYRKLSNARATARQALSCLYIAVADDVADDIREKVEAAFSAYETYAKSPKRESITADRLAQGLYEAGLVNGITNSEAISIAAEILSAIAKEQGRRGSGD